MTHAELVDIAVRWLKDGRKCGVVLRERGVVGRADALGWHKLSSAPQCILVECKRSVSDFKADKGKVCRMDDEWHGIGDERYFFTPVGLLAGRALPPGWGLIEWDGRRAIVTVKSRKVPFARLQSTMAERDILLRELRIYHAQGISYRPLDKRPLGERLAAFDAFEDDVREARQVMGLEARS